MLCDTHVLLALSCATHALVPRGYPAIAYAEPTLLPWDVRVRGPMLFPDSTVVWAAPVSSNGTSPILDTIPDAMGNGPYVPGSGRTSYCLMRCAQ